MDLLQLRYFQAVARHEHVSRAAGELRVAQPALSRSIARLEAELGVPLFERHGRRVALNRFGAAFLTRVSRALSELDQGQQELHDAAGLARGSVALAAETLRTVTDLTASFLATHPEVSFRLYQSPAPVMSAQLQAGHVDLCLASQPLAGASVEARDLLTEEVLLGVPRSHRLAARRRVGVVDLAGEAFVTTRPGYWQRALTDQLFAGLGRPPIIACEGDEPYAIRGLISAGVGIGLLPAMARQSARPPISWLHLDAPSDLDTRSDLDAPSHLDAQSHLDARACQRTLSIAWRRDAYLSTAARQFRDFAAGHFARQPALD